MLVDSIELNDGTIKSGVIESGSAFPGVVNMRGPKKGQLYYLDTQQGDNVPGLYVYSTEGWVPSSGTNGGGTGTPAGDSINESDYWMGL